MGERSEQRDQWRAARKLLEMVAQLHRLGYGLIRIAPGMSASGAYWRCDITPRSNTSPLSGARVVDPGGEIVARYTSADGYDYYGWADARDLTPSDLASLFIRRFSRICDLGRGRDDPYVQWYLQMLAATEPDAFPIAYADWDLPADALATVGGKSVEIPMPPPGTAPPPAQQRGG